jgi:putative nucleotidyltransferase with HDIG domain
MSATIDIKDLRVGMFVHLDMGWWAHPFALSSFKLSSPDQIAKLHELGLSQVRWSPEKSDVEPGIEESDATAAPARRVPAAVDRASAHWAAYRAGIELCKRQYVEATSSWSQAAASVVTHPQRAREISEGLSMALLNKMLGGAELSVRALDDGSGDRSAAHALNVSVLAMLLGRVFGFDATQMHDLGVGALLHDIGKVDLPEHLRHLPEEPSAADLAAHREHVALGSQHGQRMGITPAALQIIAQHHELADGSGYPKGLNIDRMNGLARIVALVNRFDNLCNPANGSLGLTPHEALSTIFAQCKDQFDAALLNAFIRMMGVYPPGSVVQLTDDRYALVATVNSSRPLKPRVLVHDPALPRTSVQLINLSQQSDLGIRRSLRPHLLPAATLRALSPLQRLAYFVEPVAPPLQLLAA